MSIFREKVSRKVVNYTYTKLYFPKKNFNFFWSGRRCVTATATSLRSLPGESLSTSRSSCLTASLYGATLSRASGLLSTPPCTGRTGGAAGGGRGGRGRSGDGRLFLVDTSWLNKRGTLKLDKQKLKLYRHRHL